MSHVPRSVGVLALCEHSLYLPSGTKSSIVNRFQGIPVNPFLLRDRVFSETVQSLILRRDVECTSGEFRFGERGEQGRC